MLNRLVEAQADNYKNYEKAKTEEHRKTAAEEILETAAELVRIAAETEDRTQRKLEPVMLSPRPIEENKITQPREYPPLFSELREKFITIRNCLFGINEALDRTEL